MQETQDIMDSEHLALREELISLHALNPFTPYSSSPRGLMFSGQFSQAIVIDHGETPIIQTGLERQLANNTFSKKTRSKSRVIGIVKRYNGISADSVSVVTEHTVILQDTETLELDAIVIPYYHKLHQQYGFKYKINDLVSRMDLLNKVLPADYTLADSPGVSADGDYSYGRPVNIAYMSIPEVTGDGVIISESLAKKFSFSVFETVVVEFGEKAHPLNLYGDDNNFQPFPELGEDINDDRVIMATRDYETVLSPSLVSAKDMRRYDPNFDTAYYSKAGGKVVDIKVYDNTKARVSTYSTTTDQAKRYASALKTYYNDVLSCYEAQSRKHFGMYGKNVPVTERFHRLLIDAYAMTESKRNVRYNYKNDIVDSYRIEFVIERKVTPSLRGYKITTISGS